MKTTFMRLCLMICVTCTLGWGSRFDLELYAGKFDSIPIAVSNFVQNAGSVIETNKPWEVIAADLDFTGRFLVTKMDRPDTARMIAQSIGVYVNGDYTLTGNNVVLDCRLHDASTGELIFGKKYQGEISHLRTMAHRFANELVEIMLGERGFFESKVVYVIDEGARKDLWVMDYDGHNQRRITNTNTINIFPAWADSNTIVWTSYARGKPDLYLGSVSAGTSNIFVYSRYIQTSPSVSPIDGRVAFGTSRDGNLEIYTCNLDKSDLKRLTFSRGIDTSPCWSPNGYNIAFTSDRAGSPQIYVMDRDGANVRRLTFQGNYNDSPSWSPKGDKIAYASMVNFKFDIWVIDVDGKNARQVTSSPGNNEYPCWSPDGAHLMFQGKTGGSTDLYSIRIDGTGLKRMTNTGKAKMPDWSLF